MTQDTDEAEVIAEEESSAAGSKKKNKAKSENYEGCPLSAADVEAGIAVVAKYARNFLPCLFNVFGSPVSPSLRQTVANTIAVFLEITPSEVKLSRSFASASCSVTRD
jgi:hypothetical protein